MDSIDLSGVTLARWISEKESGKELVIYNVRNVSPDKQKLDLELTVADEGIGEVYRFSLWGKNLIYMINTFGNRTDKWRAQKIRVFFEDVDGKTHRRIEKA